MKRLALFLLACGGLPAFATTEVHCHWQLTEPARANPSASCLASSDARILQIDAELDDFWRLRLRYGVAANYVHFFLDDLEPICPTTDGFAQVWIDRDTWSFWFEGDNCRPRLAGEIQGAMP